MTRRDWIGLYALGFFIFMVALVLLAHSIVEGDNHKRDYARDLQVLVADRALLAARALGEPGARDLTAAEVAAPRERCARRPEYAEICVQIEERVQKR